VKPPQPLRAQCPICHRANVRIGCVSELFETEGKKAKFVGEFVKHWKHAYLDISACIRGRERVRADLDPSGFLDLMFNSALQHELELHVVIISYRGV
jgi:hypothetical protein